MRAAVLEKPYELSIQSRPELEPAPHEAVVAVRLAGVCGTDLAIWSGGYPVPLPLVLGHEFVGVVERVGAVSDSSLEGRRVTAEINNSCRVIGRGPLCPACASGLDTHCLKRTVTGIISHDGAFAEKIVVPAANLHVIPDAITDNEAVFVEPLAAAIRTFELAPLSSGDPVVVLGVGRLGYLVAGVAKSYGGRVLAVSRSEEKCRRAADLLGVETRRAGSAKDLPGWVRKWSGGAGVSHVVEATGSTDPLVLNEAVRLVRPGGTIDLKSTPGDFSPGIPLTAVAVNELRLQGSRCGPFSKAIALLERHAFPVADLVSDVLPLDDVGVAMEKAGTVSKVLIRCESSRG